MTNTKIGGRFPDININNALDFAGQKRSISPPKIANNVVNRNPYGQPHWNPPTHLYGRQQIPYGLPYMQHIPLIPLQLQNNKLLHYQCSQLGYTINDDFSRYYGVNPKLNKAPSLLIRKKLSPKKVSQIPLSDHSYPVPHAPRTSPNKSSPKKVSQISLSDHSYPVPLAHRTSPNKSSPRQSPPNKSSPRQSPPRTSPRQSPPRQSPPNKSSPRQSPPRTSPRQSPPRQSQQPIVLNVRSTRRSTRRSTGRSTGRASFVPVYTTPRSSTMY